MTDTEKNPFGKPAADDGDIVIDGMNEVDTNPFWVPPGKYLATCTEVAKGLSNAGNPKVVFTFSISKPVQVDNPDPKAVGKDLKIHAALTPKALWKLRQTLEGLGVSCDTPQLRVKPKELQGAKCYIVVEDNDFNGDKGSNIKSVLAIETKKGK